MVRTEIEVTREGPVITAEARKQRDMAGGARFSYQLRSVTLGCDEDGESVTSATVVSSEALPKRSRALKGQTLIAMQAFGDALAEHGVNKTGEAFPTTRRCVSLDRWHEACNRHSLTDATSESAARVAFGRAWKRLLDDGLIRVLDCFAWRCDGG